MSKQVKARDGDSLCGIAIAAGFLNCAPLRADKANSALLSRPLVKGDKVTIPDVKTKEASAPTDNLHKFVKKNSPPVSIRFVHGSKDKKYLADSTLTLLNVSNFETDKAGATGTAAFPSGYGFDADADADIDTFKVEVVDPGASGTVNAVLEALKPVKQPDNSIKFQSITGVADAGLRKINALACQQVTGGHVAFRSAYLRLVVDAQDQAAANGQTLLTTDTVDAGDETLEILDQQVQASYEFSRCTGTPKCKAVAQLPIGEKRQRAKVTVQILQDPATNTPVCTVDQARTSVLKYVRQLYAQAAMSVKLVGTIRSVPAPTNLIAIANANGAKAAGGGTIKIQVQIGQPKQATFDFDKTVQVVTKKNDKPINTANALAKAINDAFAAVKPPFKAKATASGNPPLVGQTMGSADVVVGDPLTQNVSLSIVTSGDAAHPVTIGRITSTAINPDFGGADSHVGTILERTLIKNYDTGSDHIDLFVVGTLVEPDGSGDYGEAFIPNASSKASQRPISSIVNSALIFSGTFTTKDYVHTTVPHEMGHILMDNGHEVTATEMMGAGSPVGTNERVINGPKRISDRTMSFAGGFKGNPVKLLRTANTGVIDSKW